MIAPLRPACHPRAQRGQSLVEFALIMPVLAVLLMGVFDFGTAVYAYSVVNSSAREGARFAIAHLNDPGAVICRVEESAIGLNLDDLQVMMSYPDASSVRVQVSYTFRPITPLIANLISEDGVLVISSSATMYTEY